MNSTHDSPILVTGAAGAIGAIVRNGIVKLTDPRRLSPAPLG